MILHPPFGHAGEDALQEMMVPFGGFDHNKKDTYTLLFKYKDKYEPILIKKNKDNMSCSNNKIDLQNIQYFSFIRHKREPIIDMNVLIGNNSINGTIINIRDETIKVNKHINEAMNLVLNPIINNEGIIISKNKDG